MNEEEKIKITKNALFCTNMAYILADVANSFAMQANNHLFRLKKEFAREEKMRYKKAVKILNDGIKATKELAAPMYNITGADDACNDSDYLAEVLIAVVNRTDDTEESKRAMLEYIKNLPKVEHIEI